MPGRPKLWPKNQGVKGMKRFLLVFAVTAGLFAATTTTSARVDDSKPFKPKVVKYEIFGSASDANVNYLDLSAQPQRVDGAPLPWTLVLSTTAPSVFPNLSAQSNGDRLGCRITVDGEIKDENITNGVHALTFCLVKSA